MTIEEFLVATVKYRVHPEYDEKIQEHRPRVVCKDGFTVSVQASQYHYCLPTENGVVKYRNVELGFPSAMEPLIKDCAELPCCEDDEGEELSPGYYTNTVYPYTPIELVEKVIEKHGGIDIYETFKER